MSDYQQPNEEPFLEAMGVNPDRSFGPNYTIIDGRAHHVNERPGSRGLAAEFVDGKWRLARVDPDKQPADDPAS